jgi:oligopeptide transport system substrate-binding protein
LYRRSLVLLPLLLASACSTGGSSDWYGTTRLRHPADTLVVNNLTEPEWIDPGKCSDAVGSTIITNVFSGLTQPDPKTMEPRPDMAESWEVSADKRTWTFHLRAGTSWTDGTPVTAEDFRWSWARALDPATASKYADQLYSIENGDAVNQKAIRLALPPDETRKTLSEIGKVDDVRAVADDLGGGSLAFVSDDTTRDAMLAKVPGAKIAGPEALAMWAPDPRTFVVRLQHPISYFLAKVTTLYTFFPVPRQALDALVAKGSSPDLWTRPEHIVSNGPYRLTGWKFRQEMTFEKNERYWDAASAQIRKVKLLEIESQTTALQMYKAGEIDWSGENAGLPAEYLSMLKTKKDFHLSPWLAVYFYWFNVRAPGVDDPRVRRALNMAVDKQAIVDHVTRQNQLPATSIIPDGLAGYARVEGDPYDPEAARTLLAEAGHPGGKGLPPISITFNTNEGHRAIAEAIQEMWKKELGVDARLSNEAWSVFLHDLDTQNFQVSRLGWIGDYPDPITFLSVFLSGSGNNHGNWKSEEYDRLVAGTDAELDPAKRLAKMQEAERLLMREMPVLPVYWYTRGVLVKPYVKGFETNVLDRHPWKSLSIEAQVAPGDRSPSTGGGSSPSGDGERRAKIEAQVAPGDRSPSTGGGSSPSGDGERRAKIEAPPS